MISVLHVYKTSMPESNGGVESFIDTLCKSDSALGVKNIVLTLSPNPKKHPIEMDGYTVHQAKQNFFVASTGFSLPAFNKFKKLASEVDIVHYHFPNPFADMLHMAHPPKKPCIVTYHSDIIKQKYLSYLYGPLKRYFLNSVDCIIATSPNYLASSEVLQKYHKKVSVIAIGIEHNAYQKFNLERFNYWSNRFQNPFFLFVGALRYYKGLSFALEAIAGTNIRIVIAGNGGVENEIKAKAKFLQLENVDFLGSVSDEDKLSLLHLCYGFIFPSHLRSEAFGIALLEAATVGKPMISAEIGTGTTFINKNKKTGLVVTPGSISELRGAMLYLRDNPTIAATMGKNAKNRSRKLFTSERQAKLYYELYKKLLQEN